MEKGHTIPVLGNGYVRYVESLGTDESIVGAARISYNSPSKGEEADKKLIGYLYRNRHTSPFEQVNITFNIKMPIFCMRQFVRHRTFRLNEVSARYTKLPADFYVPENYRKQDDKNRQSSEETDELNHSVIAEFIQAKCDVAYDAYEVLVSRGVAREMARMVLPVNIMTEIFVNCDLHNLMHFLRLRCDGHAQSEIRDIAEAMKTIATDLYPWAMEAFNSTKVTVETVESSE